MWMNDPNGMVYYEGEYHLFYQYYPDSTVWGPMHWGHAVSRDIAHWEHLPVALYPDSLGYIFSGSAVVDWDNRSGFGKDGKPPLVAIFTHHNMPGEKAGRSDFQYQSIAYSNDRGRTWTKYAGNPVIPNPGNIRDFRDPKVIWDAVSSQWVLALAAGDHVKLYGSPDLKNWTHLSDFGHDLGAHSGVWECPDLFPIEVEQDESGGDPKPPTESRQKWVLLLSINPGAPNGGSGTQYFIGDFDGKNFKVDTSLAGSLQNGHALWLDYGRDNYAGVTWSDVPASDGRRLFMGWMSNWDYAQVVPTAAWRSAMTLPRSLSLKNTPEGLRLHSTPVDELISLRGNSAKIPSGPVKGDSDWSNLTGSPAATKEILLELVWDGQRQTQTFGIELFNNKGEKVAIGFDPAKQELFIDRTKSGKTDFSPKFASRDAAPYRPEGNRLRLHVFADVSSVEVFAGDGARVMTDIFFPSESFTGLRWYGDVALTVVGGEIWELKKIRMKQARI
ncbi:MAG: Levanase [Saprospiraceae bacterium]|nr:Levanase [Saprospiraceae bacterium]